MAITTFILTSVAALTAVSYQVCSCSNNQILVVFLCKFYQVRASNSGCTVGFDPFALIKIYANISQIFDSILYLGKLGIFHLTTLLGLIFPSMCI